MEILIYIIGGIIAGIATGLVGLSAATIIAPLFATMLGMDPYIAIGIALASDVFASATSATNYIKHKNIDLKSASGIAVSVVVFTIIASYLSFSTKPETLNTSINIFVFILGIRFLVYPVKNRMKEKVLTNKWLYIETIIWGAIIGYISGHFGAGGGLSLLALLTMRLGYNLKTGVGTSVFIMAFIALVGAVVHIIVGGTLILPLIITSISAFVGANLASKYANKIDASKLNKIIGIFLLVYGSSLIIVYFW
jgi:uncharacterized membrane protein YfcA